MTGAARGDETGRTPTDMPAAGREFAGETPGPVLVTTPRVSQGTAPHPTCIDVSALDEELGTEFICGPDCPQRELGSVQVAYLHGTRVSHSWHQSMMNLIAYDKTVGQNLIRSMPFAVQCSGPNSLVEGRNLAATKFLDETSDDWLFFVDTDMGFQPESLERLVFAADVDQRPIVGGLCFALKYMGSDGSGGFHARPVPTLYMLAKNADQGMGFANRFIYPPDALVQVAGTGAAFLLIHRRVLTAMREKDGDTWFNMIAYGDGTTVSEDLSFCYRAAQYAGAPIFVHTGIKVTHHKEFWLSEDDYRMPETEPMAEMMEAAKNGQS